MKFACGILTVLGVVALVAVPLSAQVSVETYTYTGTYNVTLPGTPSGGDVNFTGNLMITSLDFTPGSVTFQGQPVDFDGTEASFLANSYSGASDVPNNPGSPVNTAGAATTAGPAGNMNGTTEKNSVDLGPGFSAANLDIVINFDYDGLDRLTSWNSPVVPELNGREVEVHTNSTVLGVDPISGIVDVGGNGEIFGIPLIPTLSEWGLILLALGLIGLAVVYMYRRRSMAPAA
jgi:hypothetical protein